MCDLLSSPRRVAFILPINGAISNFYSKFGVLKYVKIWWVILHRKKYPKFKLLFEVSDLSKKNMSML
mgnify:FL=1